MPLILKRASISRPSGQWSDSDFDVLADSKAIGRIYEDAHLSTPPELRWFVRLLDPTRDMSGRFCYDAGP